MTSKIRTFITGSVAAMNNINQPVHRANEPGEIIGVSMITPAGLTSRACFRIRFKDGDEYLLPVQEIKKQAHYTFATSF